MEPLHIAALDIGGTKMAATVHETVSHRKNTFTALSNTEQRPVPEYFQSGGEHGIHLTGYLTLHRSNRLHTMAIRKRTSTLHPTGSNSAEKPA